MNLALFLHFYQPPIQKREIVLRVTTESYIPVIEGLRRNPKGKVTMNITGSLLSQFEKYGYGRLLTKIGRLVKAGQIELVGSSAYHAFLPNLPESQVTRQISLQEEMIATYVGKGIALKGFFSPEMAYTPSLARIVQRLGYSWMILGSYTKRGAPAYAPLYRDKQGLNYFFRNRAASYALVTQDIKNDEDFIAMMENVGKKSLFHIIGLDGETFGHHRPKHEKLLEKLYRSSKIHMHTISELQTFELIPSLITPRRSSWTILDPVRSVKQPFIRWDDPENEIHTMQWKLTEMAYRCKHDEKSQKLLDKALFSCQYWWACARPWWHIEMIEAGAHALLQTIIESHATAKYKRKAVDLYHDIIATAFDWMRSGKMQRLVDKEHEYMQTSANQMRVNQ